MRAVQGKFRNIFLEVAYPRENQFTLQFRIFSWRLLVVEKTNLLCSPEYFLGGCWSLRKPIYFVVQKIFMEVAGPQEN